MNQLLMIGAFCQQTSTSKRMLRHYDQIGLLIPAKIDPLTGYRYYHMDQVNKLNNIKLLQSYGFSLDEITCMVHKPLDHSQFLDALKDKEATLRNQIDSDVSKLLLIRRTIEAINLDDTRICTIDLESLNLERSHTTMTTNNRKITTSTDTNTDSNEIQGDHIPPTLSLEKLKKQLYSLPGLSVFTETMETHIHNHLGDPSLFLTFDIDNFMPINDLFGFDVGDGVIYTYFDLINKVFGPYIEDGYGLMSRLGGDEIALFLHTITEATAIELIEKTLELIRCHDFTSIGCSRQITSTCGLYITKNITNAAQLRHHSTKAMMEGKRLGSDQLFIISDPK